MASNFFACERRNDAIPCHFLNRALLADFGAKRIHEINFPANPYAGGVLGGERSIGFSCHAKFEVGIGWCCRKHCAGGNGAEQRAFRIFHGILLLIFHFFVFELDP